MNKSKILVYVIIIICCSSLLGNYLLFKEVQGYKSAMGSDYKFAVRKTLHELEEGTTEQWIKVLKEQNGGIALEWQRGELSKLSGEFHRMNGMVSSIGMLLDSVIEDYHLLRVNVNNEAALGNHKKEIDEAVRVLKDILVHIEEELGKDDLVWYEELSNVDSGMSHYVWEKYKAYEIEE